MLAFFGSLGAIILVDLALSGDNALVIGAAAAGLEKRARLIAIVAGGAAAIVLRIVFTVAVTLLITIPLLEAVGGVILLIIAARLLLARQKESNGSAAEDADTVANDLDTKQYSKSSHGRPAMSLGSALLTILVADVTMSLDNILAVGGVARGEVGLLALGLFISIGLLLVGSAVVAELIGRLPWLLDVAALVLGWTAGNLLHHDSFLAPYLGQIPNAAIVLPVLGVALIFVFDIVIRVLGARRRNQRA